ncbi:MAG: response regulator transcription factor [Chitinophagales bacterium]|nr:response regulator transcription factor [Chitinophagales bacterium]
MPHPIRAIIVDDEKSNRDNLRSILHRLNAPIEIIGEASNADDAKKMIDANQFDVLFLDIQMPVKNGFDLLRSIKNRNFHLIFVTAFEAYALKAIKFSALDYILKPIDPEELKLAIDKVQDALLTKNPPHEIQDLLQNIESIQKKEIEKIGLQLNNVIKYISIKDIEYIEADNGYTIIHLEREKYIDKKTLQDYEELLIDYCFFRIHHKYLINLNSIKEFKFTENPHVVLKNGIHLTVSARRKQELKKRINH